MSVAFKNSLAFGQIAETLIATWILSRGGIVLPIYEVEIDSGKGPRLFSPEGELVAPDLLTVSKEREVMWIEAKHKTAFTWHRISSQWTTGIDLHHYNQYVQVELQVKWPVWILFFHRTSTPNDNDLQHGCPDQCPTGLFGRRLVDLVRTENHRSDRHGSSGMVYWAHAVLKQLATCEEVLAAGPKLQRDRDDKEFNADIVRMWE